MSLLEKYSIFGLFLLCMNQLSYGRSDSLPVVLWHGMGDSCCFSFSMGAVKNMIQEALPGIYVYSIRIGNNEIEDVEHSYFGNINEQIQEVCEQLSKDENLKNGYNAIGFSQGAQFLRAIIQRCPEPRIRNFISIGGQHQGVFGLPDCVILGHNGCQHIGRIIKYGAYLKFVQERFIQAAYWHDPYQEDEFKNKNIFIADINNELNINQTYIDNIQKLKNMVLVKFTNDTMVWPQESEWFGFYKPGQATKIQTLEESSLYREDRLGLKALHKSGRIHFLSIVGNHLQFTKPWFIKNIVKTYLI